MSTHQEKSQIYQGTRGDEFKQFITELLTRGKLKRKYMDILTNEESMSEYDRAFTTQDADEKNNYENFEQIGDVTANKFIIWYAYKRFPQLKCPDGVAVVSRLRINYGAKASFARIGDRLGFWPFITGTEEQRSVAKKSLIEDCFEAFIGCTEFLLDQSTRVGVGYAVVYDILTSIFDEEEISLKYEDLYDSLTRVKEVFDAFHYTKLGTYVILTTKDRETRFNTSTVYLVKGQQRATPITKGGEQYPRRDWVPIGRGLASAKGDSQQKAAEKAIEKLASMGFSKAVPKKYELFYE